MRLCEDAGDRSIAALKADEIFRLDAERLSHAESRGGWGSARPRSGASSLGRADPQGSQAANLVKSVDDRTLTLKPRDIFAAHAMLMSGNGKILAKSSPTGERLANSMLCPSGLPELAAMALCLERRENPDDRIEMLRTAFATTSLPVALGLSIEKFALQVFWRTRDS
jgi:hypothetical protein